MKNLIKNQFGNIPSEVYLYPTVKFLCSLSSGLLVPIIAIYYRCLGFNLLQIGLISMVFELSMGLFEIPTGYVADRYGRKTSIVYSLICFILVGIIYLFSSSLKLIFLAVTLQGIGYTFMSGAFEAWAFDTLKLINKENTSRSMFVVTSKFRRIGLIIGSLLGSFIGIANVRYIWFIFIFINVINLLIVLMSMKENQLDIDLINIKGSSLKSKIKLLVNDKAAYGGILVIFFFIIACVYEFSMSPISEYWSILLTEELTLGETYLGMIVVISNIVVVLCLGAANKVIDKINNSILSLVILHTCMIVSIVCFAISTSLVVAIIAYISYTLFVGISEPLTKEYLNKLISSKYRATLLSVYAMAGSIGEIISGGLIGVIAESFGLRVALITSSFSIGLIIVMLKIMKQVEFKPITANDNEIGNTLSNV